MTAVEQQHAGPSTGTTGFDRGLIAPMILGSILNPINSSMLAVALVPIGKAFGAPPSQTIWLVSALYLATAVGQPVLGRLVDRYGPRTLYLIGTALVGIAGVLGALAPGLGVQQHHIEWVIIGPEQP
ncbi:MFS transporter, partial [Nocardia sp. NPDC004604]|uniref:MFS transporter n=1 Tax=Nocardia sp. NPDC004604 TaxID=3157013 RepID=UPI0033BAD814